MCPHLFWSVWSLAWPLLLLSQRTFLVLHWVRRWIVAICISSPWCSLLGAELWESHFGGDSWNSSVLVQKDSFFFKHKQFCSVPAAGTQHFLSMGKDLCGSLPWVQICLAGKSGLVGCAENQVFSAPCAEQLSCWRAGISPCAVGLDAELVQEMLLKCTARIWASTRHESLVVSRKQVPLCKDHTGFFHWICQKMDGALQFLCPLLPRVLWKHFRNMPQIGLQWDQGKRAWKTPWEPGLSWQAVEPHNSGLLSWGTAFQELCQSDLAFYRIRLFQISAEQGLSFPGLICSRTEHILWCSVFSLLESWGTNTSWDPAFSSGQRRCHNTEV